MPQANAPVGCWLIVGALSIAGACSSDETGDQTGAVATGGMSGGSLATGGALAPSGGMGAAGTMAPSGGVGGIGGAMSGGSGGVSGVGGSGGVGTGGMMASTGGTEPDSGTPEPDAGVPEDLCAVLPITAELRDIHGDIYTRYAAARGIPVLSTDSPEDEAMRRACMMLYDLGQRPDILEVMIQENIGLVLMGVDETSADFPEFAAWGVPDSRARGLGGVPRGLCAEENVMCDRSVDRWRGESICVHEFAHTMQLGVYNEMDNTFMSRLEAAFRAATSAGKYRSTYAASNSVEYFAEGVQNWYNTNIESIPANGVHNEINTRSEMKDYDPELYDIIAEVLPDMPSYQDCYYYEDD
jgi:hypothetical protein